jgi:hypothetical protein
MNKMKEVETTQVSINRITAKLNVINPDHKNQRSYLPTASRGCKLKHP